LPDTIIGISLAVALGLIGLYLKAFDLGGCLAGIALSLVIVWSMGTNAYGVVIVFVVLGSAATRVGFRVKLARGIAQPNKGHRGARHALVNLGVPAACALGYALFPAAAVLRAAFVASVASALADTLGTELGQLLSGRPVLLLQRKAVPPGTPGAVSLQGIFAGLLGAALVGVFASAMGVIPPRIFLPLMLSVLPAVSVESILGELSTQAPALTNPVRNLLLTASAAALMCLLA